MAYVKPGVEITQVQRSFSPTLISPDLAAVVVGPAYKVVNAEGDSAYNYGTLAATTQVVTISGLGNYLMLDKTSIYVDLVHTSGVNAGSRLHLDSDELVGLTDGGTTFTISGVSSTWVGAKVLVGYRALNYDPQLTQGMMTIESLSDIDDRFGGGQAVVDNPLPFALTVSLANTVSTVNAVAITTDEFSGLLGSGTSYNEHARALDILSTQEVYALAPLSVDSSILSLYRSHCDSMSEPTEKHERIAFLCPDITWYKTNGDVTIDPSAADKATTARNRRDMTTAIGMKRSFYVFPDVAYFKVNAWPVQKLKSSYVNSMYSFGTTEYAILANNYTLASGTTYKIGTVITDSVYTALKADTKYYQFDALIPVPGVFVAAAIAGQVSGQNPEQGFTNLPIAGPAGLKYSNDWFTESQLNTLAEGGNYIMVNTGGVISCRHQLSTDLTSIERRELNITKSVDYTAKYIRNTVKGYIGRSLITPAFLTTLNAIIGGLGITLVKEGRLNSFSVGGVVQDSVAKDTVRASIVIGPKYPVNYIKIDLIF